MKQRITVVVAASQPDLEQALSIHDDFAVVATASDACAAIPEVLRHRPDVLVLRGHTDFGAVRTIRRAAPDTGLLLITTTDEPTILAALQCQVRGFLTDNAQLADIARAIRDIATGAAIFSVPVADRLTRYLTGPPPHAHGLTTREREILRLSSAGLRTSAIAHQLRLAPKTIRNAMSTIRRKLQVTTGTETLVLAGRPDGDARRAW